MSKLQPDTDEYKEPKPKSQKSTKKMVSPQHIFDPELYKDITMSSDKSESPEQSNVGVEPVAGDTIPIDHDQGIFALKYSPDGSLLAVGCSDGTVRILNKHGKLQYKLKTSGNLPVTAVRWRPSTSGVGTGTLVSASSSGNIDHWHVASQKTVYSIKEDDNQIFCLDYTSDGTQFATAGKDKTIRVYDDKTKKEAVKLETGFLAKSHGHSNRVFALKYKPDDPNVLLSGSWDNTMLFWDIRSGQSFRSVYGPHIAGQAIDIQNDVIVTGSWRVKKSVQTWEFKTGKQLSTINWSPSPMMYSCQYCPTLDGIVACAGTGINELRLINVDTGAKSQAIKLPENKGIYSLEWNPDGNSLLFAGDGRNLQVVKVFQVKQNDKHSILNDLLNDDK